MSTFRRFLVVLSTLSLISAIIISILIVKQLISQLELNQSNHAEQLNYIVETYNEAQQKSFIRSLKVNFNYEKLVITDLNDNQIHAYNGSNNHIFFSKIIAQQILKSTQSGQEDQILTFEPQNLKIQYQLNQDKIHQQTDRILFIIFSFAALFSLISAVVCALLFDRIIKRITHYINHGTDKSVDLNKFSTAIINYSEALKNTNHRLIEQSERWRLSAESYQQLATSDELTGLKNRAKFTAKMSSILSLEPDAHTKKQRTTYQVGLIGIVRITKLQKINQEYGFLSGNELILQVVNVIEMVAKQNNGISVYKLNGTDIGLILQGYQASEATKIANQLTQDFKHLNHINTTYLGMASYKKGDDLGELLAMADAGLNIAQTKMVNAWHLQTDKSILNSTSSMLLNASWKQIIDRVINLQSIQIYTQRLESNNESYQLYSEVLTRFLDTNNEHLPTETFISMAIKMDRMIEIEKSIIDKTLSHLSKSDCFLGVNLTSNAINDESFLVWLERRLLRNENISARLVFELSELTVYQNIEQARKLIRMLHKCGAKLTIDHFGVSYISIKFFAQFNPDFIKLDASLCRNIDKDTNTQHFIRILIDIAHRLNIRVIGQNIETELEKNTLQKMFIDGIQGYFVENPHAIESSETPPTEKKLILSNV